MCLYVVGHVVLERSRLEGNELARQIRHVFCSRSKNIEACVASLAFLCSRISSPASVLFICVFLRDVAAVVEIHSRISRFWLSRSDSEGVAHATSSTVCGPDRFRGFSVNFYWKHASLRFSGARGASLRRTGRAWLLTGRLKQNCRILLC